MDNYHLEFALKIAVDAHLGQVDKGGQVYILHPLRVMLMMDDNRERVCALLHDVVEDSAITINDLVNYGFTAEVIEAVELLTKKAGVDYELYLQKIKANPLACKVKLADLHDNSQLSRISCPTVEDHQRVLKYQKAIEFLSR